MDLTSHQLLSLIVYLFIVLASVKPVLHQFSQSKVQHLVFGSAAAVSVLWWFRTGIYPGLDIHFLWMTALTLTLGFRWALFSSLLALGITALTGTINWQNIGIIGLIGCVLPACISYLMYMMAYHKLPRHFVVYIFLCSFFTGAMSLALKMFVFSIYYNEMGLYDWQTLVDNYLVLIPLLLFPEALLNGMTMTLGVVYRPEWIATFYDNQYLNK